MVLGEMVPKNLALAEAETLSLRVSRLFGWFVTLLRPLIVTLNAAANGLVRLTGTDGATSAAAPAARAATRSILGPYISPPKLDQVAS